MYSPQSTNAKKLAKFCKKKHVKNLSSQILADDFRRLNFGKNLTDIRLCQIFSADFRQWANIRRIFGGLGSNYR